MLTDAEKAALEDAINESLDTYANASFLIPAVEHIVAERVRQAQQRLAACEEQRNKWQVRAEAAEANFERAHDDRMKQAKVIDHLRSQLATAKAENADFEEWQARTVLAHNDMTERLAEVESERDRAKAEALREAADELEGALGVAGKPQTLYDFRIWLRARADQYDRTEA